MDETNTKFATLTLTVTAPQLVEAKRLTVSISSIRTHQAEVVRKVQFDSGSITIVTSWSPGMPTSNLALIKLNIPVKLLCDRLILKCLLRSHKHSTYKPLQQYRIIKNHCAITLSVNFKSIIMPSSSQSSSASMSLHNLNSTKELPSSLQPVSTMPSPGQQVSSIMPLPSLNSTAELSSNLQPVSTTSSSHL